MRIHADLCGSGSPALILTHTHLSEVDGVLLDGEALEQLEKVEDGLGLQVLDQRRQQVMHLQYEQQS